MRNNNLAMLGTIAVVGILAWWIGFFDPTTCTPGNEIEGWTSCESIAQEGTIILWVLIAVVLISALAWIFSKRK